MDRKFAHEHHSEVPAHTFDDQTTDLKLHAYAIGLVGMQLHAWRTKPANDAQRRVASSAKLSHAMSSLRTGTAWPLQAKCMALA